MHTIPAATLPAALFTEHNAECTCGMTLPVLLGQVAVTCSGCGGQYPVPALGFNESRVVTSTWHHKIETHCTVEDGPHW